MDRSIYHQNARSTRPAHMRRCLSIGLLLSVSLLLGACAAPNTSRDASAPAAPSASGAAEQDRVKVSQDGSPTVQMLSDAKEPVVGGVPYGFPRSPYPGEYAWSYGKTGRTGDAGEGEQLVRDRSEMPVPYPERITISNDGRVELAFSSGDALVGQIRAGTGPGFGGPDTWSNLNLRIQLQDTDDEGVHLRLSEMPKSLGGAYFEWDEAVYVKQ